MDKDKGIKTRGVKAANVYKHTKHDMRTSHSNCHRYNPGTGFVGVAAEELTRCDGSRVFEGGGCGLAGLLKRV